MAENIAVVNVEWSDTYSGEDLQGYYEGAGNERYNFEPRLGVFYGYIPTNGGKFPKADPERQWLIFFVSKSQPNAPHTVVGWYEEATFVGNSRRPDSDILGPNLEGGAYTYSATASKAVLIPAAARDIVLPKGTVSRAYSYWRERGEDKEGKGKLVRMLLNLRQNVENRDVKSLSARASQGFCIDPKRRTAVEKAAIEAVKRSYPRSKYIRRDRQADNCGWDLEFRDRETGDLWCIEVKGSANSNTSFFLSRNELRSGQALWVEEKNKLKERWRLAIVTNALDRENQRIMTLTVDEMESMFELSCLTWQATLRERDSA